jgi:ADP-ribose pyrophosphatase YjhB (NUDIX family)
MGPPRPPIADVHPLLVRDGQILLTQRHGGYAAGGWHAPSDKIDTEESTVDAVIREGFEQVGLHVKPTLFSILGWGEPIHRPSAPNASQTPHHTAPHPPATADPNPNPAVHRCSPSTTGAPRTALSAVHEARTAIMSTGHDRQPGRTRRAGQQTRYPSDGRHQDYQLAGLVAQHALDLCLNGSIAGAKSRSPQVTLSHQRAGLHHRRHRAVSCRWLVPGSGGHRRPCVNRAITIL